MRAGILVLTLLLFGCRSNKSAPPRTSSRAMPVAAPKSSATKPPVPAKTPALKSTAIVMHNVILHQANGLNLRVRWLRGSLHATNDRATPSFDDSNSFRVGIDAGAVGISLSDLTKLLNSGALQGTPLTNVTLSEQGPNLKVAGVLHKGVSLPFEMTSTLGVSRDGRIALHASKIRILKIPVGGLLKELHITAADMIGAKSSKGIQAEANDIYVDPEEVLPPPRKYGTLTAVRLNKGEIVEIFGNAKNEVQQVKQWRNFMQLRGGNFVFGKLMMYDVDMTLIDRSSDQWFEFDLARYQEQLVNGYAHLTPAAGLQIFLPDASRITNSGKARAITAEWMKNRYLPMPAELAP